MQSDSYKANIFLRAKRSRSGNIQKSKMVEISTFSINSMVFSQLSTGICYSLLPLPLGLPRLPEPQSVFAPPSGSQRGAGRCYRVLAGVC